MLNIYANLIAVDSDGSAFVPTKEAADGENNFADKGEIVFKFLRL